MYRQKRQLVMAMRPFFPLKVQCFLMIASLLVTLIAIEASAKDDKDQYMYLRMPDEDRYPVQEFQVDHTGDSTEPFFLKADYPNPRIVEFYAHWCPHCMRFKAHYIQFAKKMIEVTSDWSLPRPIEVFAVSCVPFNKVCQNHNIPGYPSVQLFSPHSSNGTKIETNMLHPLTVLRRFGISASEYDEHEEPGASDHQLDPEAAFPGLEDLDSQEDNSPYFMSRSTLQIYHDAHLSFDFAIRNGVFVTNTALPKERQETLKEWLHLVQKTFPTTASIQPVVEDLLKEFDTIVKSDFNLVMIMDKHVPPTSTWSPACAQHGTGYTCGLWTTFHIISIGTVEWNKMSPSPEYQLLPATVADTIRNYVEKFFQCEECRMHFLHEYDSCSHDRCNRLINNKKNDETAGVMMRQWRELPLWLYETHNSVNTRLRKERIERQDEKPGDTTEFSVMFPPEDVCHKCWLSEGRWEDDTIYDFLRHQYWPGVSFLDTGKEFAVIEENNELGVREPSAVVALANKENAATSSGDEDDDDDNWLKEVVPPIASIVFFVMAVIAWYRKKQFDRKGYHKKSESFSPY